MTMTPRTEPEATPWWHPLTNIPDDQSQGVAFRLLHWTILLSMLLLSMLLIVYMLRPVNRAYNVSSILIILGVMASLLLLMRRGRVKLATWVYISVFTVSITYSAAIQGGIYNVSLMAFVPMLLLASVLLGPRYAIGYTLFAAGVVTLLWLFGPTPEEAIALADPNLAFTTWSTHVAVYLIFTLMVIFVAQEINRAVQGLRVSKIQLESRNIELQQRIAAHEATERRLQQIFDNSPHAIMTLNPDRTLRDANPRARQVFDIEDTSDGPRFHNHLLHPEDKVTHSQIYATLFSEDNFTVLHTESRLIYPNNAERLIRLTFTRVDEASTPYALVIVEDVTEVRAAEQDRLQLELERERSDFLQEFVSHVTHDLKNPLAVINTSLYLLQRKFPNPAIEQYTERIALQVAHQQAMIEDMLTTAQLDQLPTAERTLLDTNALLTRIGDEHQPSAAKKGQTLQLSLDPNLPLVELDPEKLSRALSNLVSNAIKYTPQGGAITLTTAHAEGQLHITVTDTGIGIPEDAIPHIFERFYRTPDARQNYNGTGLGLAVVKRVVDLHEGEIDIESTLGEGTSIRLLLPLVAPGARAASDGTEQADS